MADWTQWADEVERATYCLWDNKLRLYTTHEKAYVPNEMYAAFKEEGATRAPLQGCWFFVWTPVREGICIALAGEIEDEDTTPEERAEMKAERVSGYAANAKTRAHAQYDEAHRKASFIPPGQPMMPNHHSYGRDKRYRDSIERGFRKAFEEFSRSEYWEDKAAGVVHHAQRAQNPQTIKNRIAGYRKFIRDCERTIAADHKLPFTGYSLDALLKEGLGYEWPADRPYGERTLAQLPHGYASLCQDLWEERVERMLNNCARSIAHYMNLIAFWESVYNASAKERGAMAVDQQWPLKKGTWVLYKWGNQWGQISRVNRTRAEPIQISSVTLDISTVHPTPRQRRMGWDYSVIGAYADTEEELLAKRGPIAIADAEAVTRARENAERQHAEREAAKPAAIPVPEVVVNYDPSYYPTPYPVVDQMIDELDVPLILQRFPSKERGIFVLDPSAGDGRLLDAVVAAAGASEYVFCVGIDTSRTSFEILQEKSGIAAIQEDFLEYANEPGTQFDMVAMNPPFDHGVWARHVIRAMRLLRPGGRGVAIVPKNFRSNEAFTLWLDGWDGNWYDIPVDPDAFKDVGTRMQTWMLVFEKAMDNPNMTIAEYDKLRWSDLTEEKRVELGITFPVAEEELVQVKVVKNREEEPSQMSFL